MSSFTNNDSYKMRKIMEVLLIFLVEIMMFREIIQPTITSCQQHPYELNIYDYIFLFTKTFDNILLVYCRTFVHLVKFCPKAKKAEPKKPSTMITKQRFVLSEFFFEILVPDKINYFHLEYAHVILIHYLNALSFSTYAL